MMRRKLKAVDSRAKLAFLVVFMIVTLHARSALSLALCLTVAALLAIAVRLPMRTVRAATMPLVPILALTVFMQVVTMQQGPAIAQVGGIAITQAALAESARMLASLLALVLASVSFMQPAVAEHVRHPVHVRAGAELLHEKRAPVEQLPHQRLAGGDVRVRLDPGVAHQLPDRALYAIDRIV